MKSTGNGYLKGAAVLGAAAIVSKLLGTLQKIPLQNLAGEEAFGIYNIVYPLYTFILTLAVAGLPLTVSAFVSEARATGKPGEARRVLRTASAALAATGLVGFLALYFGAEWIAGWLGAPKTAAAIRSVSWALVFAPVMAALRGYFQGFGEMVPTAVSQVAEQFVRVAVMIALLLYFLGLGAGPARIAAGATFGSAAGAVAGLAVMLGYWRREKRRLQPAADGAGRERAAARSVPPQAGVKTPSRAPSGESTAAFVRHFLRAALPVCLGSVALPVLTLVDSASLPRLLAAQGLGESARLHAIGLYNHAQPLVQLTSLIATSMTAALVPAIAEAKAAGRPGLIARRTELPVRFAWLIGFAASFGLAAAAKPINIMLFTSAEGTRTMALLAFTAAFSTLQIVSGSVLIGLGQAKRPALYLFAAAAAKLALNALLVPAFGIAGAAAAGVAANALAAVLNLAALTRLTGVRFAAPDYLGRPFIAALAMTAAVLAVRVGLSGLGDGRAAASVTALAAVLLGAAVYAAALIRAGGLTRADAAALPGGSGKLVPLLERLRLLR
ncbi:putative polysaccharide biosynthesis protein [Gorillibacterium sp. sgz500922]|uniref:putative polysaccharide biosynthesis protein n=1 Tax=Gorillibacterium sp. sgz500922 TaxID=3446694 RepID=UPI003F669DE8